MLADLVSTSFIQGGDSILNNLIYWRRVEAEDLRGAFPPFRYKHSGGCLCFGPVVSVWSRPARGTHCAADTQCSIGRTVATRPSSPRIVRLSCSVLSAFLAIRCHVHST
jgi:hypothetical protein